MIKSVTITNDLGETITMGIGDRDVSGLLITEIDGISPSKASILTASMSSIDGSEYTGAKMEERNITISIAFNPLFYWDDTIEDMRHLCYKYFPIKKNIKLEFNTDTRKSYIFGYVEDVDVNLFSNQESASISIICPDPYFRVEGETVSLDVGVVTPMFEFPFSNESLDEDLIIFGEEFIGKEDTVHYPGDVDTGCIVTFRAKGPVSNIEFINKTANQSINISSAKVFSLLKMNYDSSNTFLLPIEGSPGKGSELKIEQGLTSGVLTVIEGLVCSGIVSGDVIVINTTVGHKSVTLKRGPLEYDILGALDVDFDWVQILRGYNTIDYQALYGRNNLEMNVSFPILYSGV